MIKDPLTASISQKIKNQGSQFGIDFNTGLSQFFFDEFLRRLASSPYKDRFFIKGGILLTSHMGFENRSTIDIDFMAKGMPIDPTVLRNALDKIVATDERKGIWFEIDDKTTPIRPDDEYGGVRFEVIGHLPALSFKFPIDIATGDPVYPGIRKGVYTPLLGDSYELNMYPIESVLAEKMHSILSKGETNSRCKDFYDVHAIYTGKKASFDASALKKAIELTFSYRKVTIDNKQASQTLNTIVSDKILQSRWSHYARKHPYARGIELKDTVATCSKLLNDVLGKNWTLGAAAKPSLVSEQAMHHQLIHQQMNPPGLIHQP